MPERNKPDLAQATVGQLIELNNKLTGIAGMLFVLMVMGLGIILLLIFK